MRAKGISYDTGFVRGGTISRERFDPDVVRRELRIIRDDLNCTAVRVNDKGTGAPIRLNGEFTRDEAGQATYLRELVEIFDTNGVDSAFAFLFALDNFPHRPDGDPRDDLDLASPGIVKVLDNHLGDTYPDIPWEPKTAFTALADSYRA